jgi:alkyl hydroperoxide reductase subunit AhpF
VSDTGGHPGSIPFDEDTWRVLPALLEKLPEPVCLYIWGDESAGAAEREAAVLAQTLAARFPERVSYRLLPRRVSYPYYPVIGIMAGTAEESTDLGLRIIGLPIGLQMTSLVAAIQAVSFRGQTLEPLTRVKLHRLDAAAQEDVNIEVLTSAEDEAGALVAGAVFGAAAAAKRVKAFVIITDFFPEAAQRYSVSYLPHTVINRRVHYQGILTEDELINQIKLAVVKAVGNA